MKQKEFAVCFSGQPRCIENAYKDFQILFDGLEYDVFAHIWDSDELLSSWGHNMGFENRGTTKLYTPQQFIDIFSPKNALTEEYKQTEFYKNTAPYQGYRNPTNKVWSSYSQFYSIMKSFEAKEFYEVENQIGYKYTVKWRMDHDVDFEFSNLTTQDLIKECWDDIRKRLDEDPKLIITNPGYDWPNGQGVSNLLAIGNSQAMVEYSKVYNHYPWLLKNCQYPEWDEANLKLYLEKICGFSLGTCSINVGVYR